MYLTSQDINNLTESTLIDFLNKKIIEGHHIDYKESFSGDSDHSKKREFLKDVSGFANASGGNILLGVKEPLDKLSAKDQIIGIQGGEGICETFENLARDCIRPRIIGFQIVPVKVFNDKTVIVVHVPPSTIRPHMVNFKGNQYFYIRHQESTNPMMIDEIRETVISSLSAEAKAKKYLEEQEREVLTYDYKDDCALLLLQAIPLFPPEAPWDVFNDDFKNLLMGKDRMGRYQQDYDLRAFSRPRPSIYGMEAFDGELHKTQIHRNGYISTAFFISIDEFLNKGEAAILSNHHHSTFKAFCEICSKAVELTGSDLQIIMRCKLFNASKARLDTDNSLLGLKYSKEYRKNEIFWPDQIRLPGEDFFHIAKEWFERMYNAFGYLAPDNTE